MFWELKQFIYQKNKLLIVMNKKDDYLIKALYEKLKIFKKDGLSVTKKDVEDFFYSLINKN